MPQLAAGCAIGSPFGGPIGCSAGALIAAIATVVAVGGVTAGVVALSDSDTCVGRCATPLLKVAVQNFLVFHYVETCFKIINSAQ